MGKKSIRSDKTFDAHLERLRVGFIKAKESLDEETGVLTYIKNNHEQVKSFVIVGLLALVFIQGAAWSAYNDGYLERATEELSKDG